MVVIAKKMTNKEHESLHWDFIRETALSFNVTLHEYGCVELPKANNTVIALKHDFGIPMDAYDFRNTSTILLGCDDSDNLWMEGYAPITIKTPRPHHLWSGVALGILLHEINRS